MGEKNELQDNVLRSKAPSFLGRTVFVGLRALDVVWQHHLLTRGLLHRLIDRLGGQSVASSHISTMNGGELQPYGQLVLALSLGSSLKQILAMIFVSEQETPVSSAAMIAAFNSVINTVNTLFSVWALSSPTATIATTGSFRSLLANPAISIGISAYAVGIIAEAISEFQRRAFKRNPANKGMPYSGGLFSLARHINYGGYTMWRAGYATVTGGIAWGAIVFSFFFYDFATRGVPVLDKYLVDRYGENYTATKRRVRYVLIPGVF